MKVGGEDKRLVPQPADHGLDLNASAFIRKDLEGTTRTSATGYRSRYQLTHLRLQLPLVQRRFLSLVGEGVGEVPVQVHAVLVEPEGDTFTGRQRLWRPQRAAAIDFQPTQTGDGELKPREDRLYSKNR